MIGSAAGMVVVGVEPFYSHLDRSGCARGTFCSPQMEGTAER